MISITLPDSNKVNVKEGTTIAKFAEKLDISLAKNAVAALVDDELVDLSFKLNKNAKVEIVTVDSKQGQEILRHSASHILASAVKKVFPNVKLGKLMEDIDRVFMR